MSRNLWPVNQLELRQKEIPGTRDSRVALDTTMAALDRAGTGTYIRNLAAALRQVLGDRLVLVEFPIGRALGRHRTPGDKAATLLRDLWWNQWGVVRAVGKHHAGLLHLPAAVGPLFGATPKVVTVHDLAFLHFPRLFRTWFRSYARVVVPRLARSARAVITVSQASRQDIVTTLGIPPGRVFAIPNGVDEAFRPVDPVTAGRVTSRYRLPASFALTVGSLEPRKNLSRLFQAVELLRSRAETSDLTLVHAGPPGWLARDLRRFEDRLAARGVVRSVGYVPPSQLPAMYSAARLMVYPSLFEGFGLPVLEAMACGCPVVTSGAGATAEVAGDAAVLVNPLSVDDIADGLARVWGGAELRGELRERGLRRSREFSWERAARATAEVYEHCRK